MRLNNVRWPASDRRTKGLRDMHGITFARVVGVRVLALGMLTACVSAGQTLAAGGENGAERYRSLAGGVVIKKSAIALSPDALAQGKPSVRAEFYGRIRPFLSAGGYYSLFGAGEITRAPEIRLHGATRAPVPELPNKLVNDPSGEECGSGCVQSEPSIAVSGIHVVIGFNDIIRGAFDGSNDYAGYSYSVDGGMNWIDGGALPLAGGGDALFGDPALVSCKGSFYYASLYRAPQTQCSSTGTIVEETEPNDVLDEANQVSLGDDFRGTISSSSDADFVGFFAPAGTILQVTTVPGTLSDSILVLFAADGTPLAFAVGSGPDSPARIVVQIPASDTYYVGVGSLSGSTGSYAVKIQACAGSVLPGVSAVSVSRGVFSGPVLIWDAPIVAAAAGGDDLLDKDYIACDPSTGTLYVAYTRFLFSGSREGQIELVRSTDLGTSWSPPTVVEPEDPALLKTGAIPEVGPGHEVYVAWEQGGLGTSGTGRATMQLAKSLDGGATFPTKTQVAEFVETAVQVPLGLDRILDFPSIAVDRSGGPRNGNIYVVFEEADRDVRDIKLARSTDGGSSFAPAVRVNDDPPGADQFFPWIAVDPTDGQISVISYDRRLSRTPGLTDVFLTQSNDGGVTFRPGVRVTDVSSNFFVSADATPRFGDYINVTADGTAIYATWADGRNGDPDVFFSKIAKDTAPFLLLQGFSIDDSGVNGDGDGVPEPGESPRLKVALRNTGATPATRVSATLSTRTPRVNIIHASSMYGTLLAPGSVAPSQTLYQFTVDPSLECSRTVVCPPISTEIYGVDPGGTIVRFAFDTGVAASVATPGDSPSGGPDGLAVKTPMDAFWVNGFGLDSIFEFNPQTGNLILGSFPVASPGTPGCTDGLALAAPTRLFTQNFCEGKLYEIDTRTGLVANGSLQGGLGLVGGLAGGNGRLFATVGFKTIAEVDPDSGEVRNSFPAPDLNGDGVPDTVYGLAFDGTRLFAASQDAAPPNVAAVDPADGKLLAVSPFIPPSGFLSALDAVATPPESVCVAGTFRTVVDLDLNIPIAPARQGRKDNGLPRRRGERRQRLDGDG